ncbi:MAG: hypothetical protein ACD_50C00179G0003 [uncultured bacterium]|nr:MAG: hypothetical protein ACD_50C00179G0003 [uncultured bacterium]
MKLIDENGKQLGILRFREAMRIAKERDLDLVEVNSKSKPPIVRLMDYGRHRYRTMKMQRKSKSKTKKVGTKGVRIGLRTGKHDLEFKAKQGTKFLTEGHRLKIEFVLKGRERIHRSLAEEKLDDFVKNMIKIKTITVQKPKRMGMGMVTVITKDLEANIKNTKENK